MKNVQSQKSRDVTTWTRCSVKNVDIYDDDNSGRVNRFRCIETTRISRTALSDRSANWTERRPVHVHEMHIYIYIYERERAERTEAKRREDRGWLIRGGEQRCTDWRIARRFAGRLQVKPMQRAERTRSRADRRRGRAGILNKDSNVTSGSDPGKLL